MEEKLNSFMSIVDPFPCDHCEEMVNTGEIYWSDKDGKVYFCDNCIKH